jgi:hypothetical protein
MTRSESPLELEARAPGTDGRLPRLPRLLAQRAVQIGLVAWAATNVALIALGGGHLPFHATKLAEPPTAGAVLQTNLMFFEVFALMGVVHLLTRHRPVPDIAARAPERAVAARETALVLAYGALTMVGGYLFAHAFGWHAFGLHLDGMIIRTDQEVVPREALAWSAYNLLAYAVLPLLFFRRRYTATQLGLRSSNWRSDLKVILVVLGLELTVQLLLDSEVLRLDSTQLLLGAPLTFVISFAGTVLPAMVFVYCILTPRYLRLTGSFSGTVILGGLTYAALHMLDGWTNLASPTDALLSALYVLLFYTGPGMFKTFITLRTGNAWAHVWAYHALAPHTLIDTPMFVEIFDIK